MSDNKKENVFPNGRKMRVNGKQPKPVEEYNGITPVIPSKERDVAARNYMVRLGGKIQELTWKPAFEKLKECGITPGRDIETMEEIAAAVMGLVSKGCNMRFAIGCLHVGQCTTLRVETIEKYILDNYPDLFAFSNEIATQKYISELESYVFDPNVDTKDIAPRADILKWLLGKKDPERYGNKTINEHTGKNGAPIEQAVVFHLPINPRNPQIAIQSGANGANQYLEADIEESEEEYEGE